MLVSIITPVYNSSKYISKTIESVISQTFSKWELLIVDDCSSDNSINVVQKYQKIDSRIQLIALKNNVGPAEARNVALRRAKGKYIAFLDSDDIWYPTKLEKQLEFMRNNDYAFTFSGYECINESGNEVLYTVKVPGSIGYKTYLKNTIIGTLTVIIDREQTGHFEMPVIRSSHDLALWLLLMKRGFKAFGFPEVLAKYRQVKNSNTASKLKAAKDVWRVYRDFENLSFISRSFNFFFYAFNAIKKRLI